MKALGTMLFIVSGVLIVLGTAAAALPQNQIVSFGFFAAAAYFFLCGIIAVGFGSLLPPLATPPHKVRTVIGGANGRLISRRAKQRTDVEAASYLDSL